MLRDAPHHAPTWIWVTVLALLIVVALEVRGLHGMLESQSAEVYGMGQTITHTLSSGAPVTTERLFSRARWPDTDGVEPLASWLERHRSALSASAHVGDSAGEE